jgi:ABC-2 type transport system permease protein
LDTRRIIGANEPDARIGWSPLRWGQLFWNDVCDLWRSRFLFMSIASTTFQSRYSRARLGGIWGLLNPLLMLGLLSVVFGYVIGRNIEAFPVYLFTGLVPFMLLSASISSGSRSLIGYRQILNKYEVNMTIIPLAKLSVDMVDMFLRLIAMFVLLQFMDVGITSKIVLLVPAVVFLTLFAAGLSLLLAPFVTLYRDLEHITDVFLRMLYFISPVLLRPQMLGPYRYIMDYNPVTPLLRMFRYSIYYHMDYAGWPTAGEWVASSLVAVVTLVAGYMCFRHYSRRLVLNL